MEAALSSPHSVAVVARQHRVSGIQYLQLPLQAEPSRDAQIRQTPLSGGTSRLILHAPAIWNYQCDPSGTSIKIETSREIKIPGETDPDQ